MDSQQLQLWNMRHPVGTPVRAKFRAGDDDPRPNPLLTKTNGIAFLGSAGEALVTVAGIHYAIPLRDIVEVESKPLLTSLADYSRQPLQVGTPAHFVFDRDGRPANKEVLQLGLLQRIANAMEGNEGQLTARLLINPAHADDFRDLVGDQLDGRPLPLAIVGWYLLDETRLEVALQYEDGEVLFFLGRYWEFFTTKQAKEGGQQHD